MLHPQPVSLNCRQSVPVVEGALGFWSSSNTAPMMTPLDFETSAENAQRWLAGLRPKNTSGGVERGAGGKLLRCSGVSGKRADCAIAG